MQKWCTYALMNVLKYKIFPLFHPISYIQYAYFGSIVYWCKTLPFYMERRNKICQKLALSQLTDNPWLALGGVGPRGWRIFFLTSTRWLPMYENQNPATISRQKCYQMYLWPFQTSKINFLLNDPFFYWSVPKVAYWWVEQHITRSVSVPQPLQSYRLMRGTNVWISFLGRL